MRKPVAALLAGALLLPLPPAAAAEKEADTLTAPPSFLPIAAENGVSSLRMECDGQAPFLKIHCRFTEIDVDKTTDAEWQKERQELEKELAAKPEEVLRKQIAPHCSSMVRMDTALKADQGNPARVAYMKRWLSSFKPACAATDKPALIKALLAQKDDDRHTCAVGVQTFEADFQKAGERKWISNNGPEGLCHLVNVLVIEHEPGSPLLWTFTHTRAAGVTDSPLCKGFQINKPFVFSWKSSSYYFLMGCDVIKLNQL